MNSVTIDADSGSTLILTGTISGGLDLGNSGVTSFTLVKEGTGTVVLDPTSADGNAYDGTTAIYQGALVAENSNAFGYALFPANAVEVLDGAQLQLSGAINVFNSLYLSGSGIDNTGAILDIGGDNTWTGTITLEILPGFTPFTLTPGTVAIGADAGDILTLAGEIEEESATTNTLPLTTPSALPDNELPIGLDKVDPGTVALSNANTYTGETQVLEGYLDVQNDAALGARTAADTQTIEQIITLSDSGPNGEGTGNFTLSWNSKPAVKVLSFGASATAVQDALEGPPGTGLFASAGTVTVYRTAVQNTAADGLAYIGAPPPPNSSEVTGWVYTLVFGGGLAETTDQVKAVGSLGTVASASVVADGGNDVVVANNLLGSGELELDNSALPSGNLVIPNYTLTLNGSGPSGTITVTPGATGGFVLKYTGPNIGGTVVTDSTPASGAGELKASSPTLAGDIENALDNLANIGGVGDNVVVTATSTAGVFAIQFIGGLPSLAVATQPASGSVSIQESQGALENLVGNNTWSGPIVLENQQHRWGRAQQLDVPDRRGLSGDAIRRRHARRAHAGRHRPQLDPIRRLARHRHLPGGGDLHPADHVQHGRHGDEPGAFRRFRRRLPRGRCRQLQPDPAERRHPERQGLDQPHQQLAEHQRLRHPPRRWDRRDHRPRRQLPRRSLGHHHQHEHPEADRERRAVRQHRQPLGRIAEPREQQQRPRRSTGPSHSGTPTSTAWWARQSWSTSRTPSSPQRPYPARSTPAWMGSSPAARLTRRAPMRTPWPTSTACVSKSTTSTPAST